MARAGPHGDTSSSRNGEHAVFSASRSRLTTVRGCEVEQDSLPFRLMRRSSGDRRTHVAFALAQLSILRQFWQGMLGLPETHCKH